MHEQVGPNIPTAAQWAANKERNKKARTAQAAAAEATLKLQLPLVQHLPTAGLPAGATATVYCGPGLSHQDQLDCRSLLVGPGNLIPSPDDLFRKVRHLWMCNAAH